MDERTFSSCSMSADIEPSNGPGGSFGVGELSEQLSLSWFKKEPHFLPDLESKFI